MMLTKIATMLSGPRIKTTAVSHVGSEEPAVHVPEPDIAAANTTIAARAAPSRKNDRALTMCGF
jgi:hypothetical protein